MFFQNSVTMGNHSSRPVPFLPTTVGARWADRRFTFENLVLEGGGQKALRTSEYVRYWRMPGSCPRSSGLLEPAQAQSLWIPLRATQQSDKQSGRT
ncbi:Hypp4074 [Branchiostoma lanceolatum]|uniref:Hypp4074 protein n=1 Tax=Branchiostoma lanceolatum TaxID=7740 RepID=A0A8K0A4Q1_BRALA|nr:Hypp4074 [Branchiostoma lanceolatum]